MNKNDKKKRAAKSILISCGARLAPFDIQELRELTAYDELQLDTLGDRKTALFIIMSDTDDTFNFLISMCYTQLFNLLCEKADDVYGGRLPVHVRCLIDEAANIGQIPRLEKLVATIRSREISMVIDSVDEDDVWYTMPSVPEQEPVSMERTDFERYMVQGNITVVPAEQAIAAEKSEPVAETSAAAYAETPYKVGDTVYLDDTLFEITEVGDYNVQLRDPALAYPIFRAESKAQFERLLQQDYRNGGITEFLPAELTDLLIDRVLVYPDNRIEIAYKIKDILLLFRVSFADWLAGVLWLSFKFSSLKKGRLPLSFSCPRLVRGKTRSSILACGRAIAHVRYSSCYAARPLRCLHGPKPFCCHPTPCGAI